MEAFRKHSGLVAVLDRVNVDTDQIIPKQFLKRIERTGFGQFLFFDWRFESDGKTLKSDFELNAPRFQGASILISGANFGCGSSREHAPWALLDAGFKVIIASSFADIFYNNCFKNGILPIVLQSEPFTQLRRQAAATPGYRLEVDLEAQQIRDLEDLSIDFEVDAFRKECLLGGLDDIGLTLLEADAIAEYEKRHFPDAVVGVK